ncbi:uncharacterized protein LOC106473995 [Limulus polyphemus]|uniref:Uncharacterized protein LOC106473995 n=1 Tax=Limulus polyphemus TaxID=6850 RepID=A0ABM1BWQ1_LIMPO|nr:uncharacterized protein LOC106473995 [Limulus polyphemus]
MVFCASPLVPAISCPATPPSVYPVSCQSQFFSNTAVIPIATSPTWKQSFGMEHVWQVEFQRLFAQYFPHLWFLSPVEEKPTGPWNVFVDSAKVRFCCEVLANVYNRVGQVYYGFYLPPIHRSRRPGKPRTPHNSDLCQACKDGVCTERR